MKVKNATIARKKIWFGLVLAGIGINCGAATLSTTGDWNVGSNWDTGSVPGATDQVVVNGGRTVTIQTSNAGDPRNILLGANSTGTLVVNGTLDTAWKDIKLGVWGNGNGILKVLGGTVGTIDQQQKTIIGEGKNGTADSGTLQIGDGTLGGVYYSDDLYMLNVAGMTGTGLLDVQNGTLDASGKSINIGYLSGTATTAQMKVGGAAMINASRILIGNSPNSTSGKLTINGSGVIFNLSNYITLASNSVVDLNFDDNGISTLVADKFYYANGSVDVNITGTEYVASGTYELFVGTTGGSGHGANTINFNIDTNSFGTGATLKIFYDTNGGREVFSLELTSSSSPPPIGDISIDVQGTNAVIYFNGTGGYSYALQSKQDLTYGNWSNMIVGISGTGGMQAVSNGVAADTMFYRIVAE